MAEYDTRRVMMVDTQVRPSDVTKFPVIDAMLAIPREAYVPADKREVAYMGDNIDIGDGRVLLEPRSFAKMLDALDIQRSDVVLDLGCGLGYSSAVLAHMSDAVVAVEDSEARADEAQQILIEQGVDNAAVLAGNISEGAAKSGPYDVIIIQGAVEQIPAALLDQLKDGGRITCIFSQGALGIARIGYKIDGQVNWRDVFNAAAPVMAGFEEHQAFVL